MTGVRVRMRDGGNGCSRPTRRWMPRGAAHAPPSGSTRWVSRRARLDEVDSGLTYASRIFRAPAGTEDYPVVAVQPDPAQPVPGCSTIVPVEGGRWLVTPSPATDSRRTPSRSSSRSRAACGTPWVGEADRARAAADGRRRQPQHDQPAALLREGQGLAGGVRRARRRRRHVQPGLRARHDGGRTGRAGAARPARRARDRGAGARAAGAAGGGPSGDDRLGAGRARGHPLPGRDRRAARGHAESCWGAMSNGSCGRRRDAPWSPRRSWPCPPSPRPCPRWSDRRSPSPYCVARAALL